MSTGNSCTLCVKQSWLSDNINNLTENSTAFKNTPTSKIVLLLSMAVSLYWIFGRIININSNKAVGAIFEILWLPAIAMTCILPVVSCIFLFKEKFNVKSLYLYSVLILLIAALTIKILIF